MRDMRTSGPNCLHFHAIFGENWRNNRLVHPLILAPTPLGNPRSVTDNIIELITSLHVVFPDCNIKLIQLTSDSGCKNPPERKTFERHCWLVNEERDNMPLSLCLSPTILITPWFKAEHGSIKGTFTLCVFF